MNSLNKKLSIAVGTLGLLLVGLFVAFKLTQKPQIIEKKAVETPASLSLSPSSGTFNKDESFAVNIFLNTGGKDVIGVQVSLSFDSEKLQVQGVSPGNLFQGQTVLENKIDGNKIFLDLGSLTTPYNGDGVYGTIQFLAQTAGTAVVNFDPSPQTKVSEQGTADNILGQTNGGSYEIVQADVDPSPTPTGETTPTPTSTSTPTPSPTSIPPTPTPTSTPSPIPSPTPTTGTGGPPEPTATLTPTKSLTSTPAPISTSTPVPTNTPTSTPGGGIGGATQATSTPTPMTQVGMGELSPPTSTPTPIQLPSAGFALPSIFVILTSALLIISAIIFI